MAKIHTNRSLVRVTRVGRSGDSLAIVLNRHVRDLVNWQLGDPIAVRLAGEKLILERINLNEYAKLRTGEAEVRDANPSN